MPHIDGLNRNQLTLFPEALDDYISLENAVRFIDAFIYALELEQMSFAHAVLKETGRPPYHPGDLLKLDIYGYLNRIRSSRQLERESHRNVEVMWPVKRLSPDFKTIANFRRNNREPIREVCREFTFFYYRMDLFSRDLVAFDGSKFKAVNRRDRNFTRKQIKRTIRKLDDDIDHYLDEMDEADEEEPEEKKLTAEELQEKIKEIKRSRAEAEKMKPRKSLAEHPFGTIKHHWDQGCFLTRKLSNVRAEMALSVLAYDIKRAINIFGVRRMIEALVWQGFLFLASIRE